ncbi:hypothetical protein DFP73DRAFT_635957 [Morchella snyderi]|nr:hypothetical protein DFP73DRAFT_635957 [Morchella snyderi]
MTLGSETAGLLHRSVDALLHLTTPAPYALISAEERRSALRQLMVTTEAAANLAEAVHLDALTAQRQLACWPARNGGTGAIAESIGPETRSGSCVDGMPQETVREVDPQPEEQEDDDRRPVVVTTERLSRNSRMLDGDVERSVAEGERLEALVRSLGKDLDSSVQETARLRGELAWVRSEKAIAEADMMTRSLELGNAMGDCYSWSPVLLRHNPEMQRRSEVAEGLRNRFEKSTAKTIKLGEEEGRLDTGLERSVRESERLQVELHQVGREKAYIDLYTERLKSEAERVGSRIQRQ